MEETRVDKVLCPRAAGWVLITVTLILIWCGALLWCVLSALSHMMR